MFKQLVSVLVELGGNPHTALRSISHAKTATSPRQTGGAFAVRSTSWVLQHDGGRSMGAVPYADSIPLRATMSKPSCLGPGADERPADQAGGTLLAAELTLCLTSS